MSEQRINPAACTAPVYILETWGEWFEELMLWTERHRLLCFVFLELLCVIGIITS